MPVACLALFLPPLLPRLRLPPFMLRPSNHLRLPAFLQRLPLVLLRLPGTLLRPLPSPRRPSTIAPRPSVIPASAAGTQRHAQSRRTQPPRPPLHPRLPMPSNPRPPRRSTHVSTAPQTHQKTTPPRLKSFLEKTLPAHETPTPFRLRIPTNHLRSLRSRGHPVAVCASGYVVPRGGPARTDAPPDSPPPLHARLAGHARKPDAERVLHDQHRARGSVGRRGAGCRRHLQLPDVLHLLALLRHEHRNAGPGGPLLRRPRPRHGPHRRTPGNAHRRPPPRSFRRSSWSSSRPRSCGWSAAPTTWLRWPPPTWRSAH